MTAPADLARHVAEHRRHQKVVHSLESIVGAPHRSYCQASRNEADQSIEVIQTQINRRRRMSQRAH